MIDQSIPTFLKTSRVHVILPKHSTVTGRCTTAIIIGSVRCISMGYKYQSNWSIPEPISSNASVIRWLSSQVMNTEVNAHNQWGHRQIFVRMHLALNNKKTLRKKSNKLNILRCKGTQLFPLEQLALQSKWLHVKRAMTMGWNTSEKSFSALEKIESLTKYMIEIILRCNSTVSQSHSRQ